MAAPSRIDLDDVEGVRVVRFRDRRVYDDRAVREVSEQILEAVAYPGPIQVVVDFSGVDLISSSLLGKLILLQRKVDASSGRLRLCEMSPTVRAVFRTSNLDRFFGIDRDRREALESF